MRIWLSHIDSINMVSKLNKLSIYFATLILHTFKVCGVIKYITNAYFSNF